MTAQEIIEAALRKIGAIASGETPTAGELADGLEALQVMLRSWSANFGNLYATEQISHTLTAGTASYTIGPSKTMNHIKPNRIDSAFIRDSLNLDYSVEIITLDEYTSIASKTTGGRPSKLAYDLSGDHTGTYAYIFLYPTPDTAETLYMQVFTPFTETASFALVTDTHDFPLQYERPMIYNLAVELAPEFGRNVSPEVVAIAQKSMKDIRQLNMATRLTPVKVSLTHYGKPYNINEG